MAEEQGAQDAQGATDLKRRARRRLIGAIALVLFAVIVLPIIFDSEPKPISQDLTIQIPSQDSGRFNSRVLPPVADSTSAGKSDSDSTGSASPPAKAAVVPEKPGTDKIVAAQKFETRGAEASKADPARADGGKAESAKIDPARAESTKSEVTKVEAPRAEVAKAAPKTETKPAASKDVSRNEPAKTEVPKAETAKSDSAGGGEGFAIAMGLFRNAENVKKVRAWIGAAGLKSYTEESSESAGKAGGVLVRAGPFATREAAEQAREKLKARGVDVGAIVAR